VRRRAEDALARILEPTSKLDSLRVLSEVGIDPASYATFKRRLPVYAEDSWRQRLAAACAKHAALGPGIAGALRRLHPVLRDRRR
jgi:hypothetical protein